VDFGAIFSKLTQYDFRDGRCWSGVLHQEQRARGRGRAPFIQRHIIEAAAGSFDDFAGSGADQKANARMLGLR